MGGDIPLFPLHEFMAWAMTNLFCLIFFRFLLFFITFYYTLLTFILDFCDILSSFDVLYLVLSFLFLYPSHPGRLLGGTDHIGQRPDSSCDCNIGSPCWGNCLISQPLTTNATTTSFKVFPGHCYPQFRIYVDSVSDSILIRV